MERDNYRETENSSCWLHVPGTDSEALAAHLSERVSERTKRKEYLPEEVEYVKRRTLSPASATLRISPERLEKLRTLCQLWDVDIRMLSITSHRKVVGPVIVALKKVLYRFLKVLLKDTLRQQRSFNSEAVSLLVDLSDGVEGRAESIYGQGVSVEK